ncbi:MAG: hypothetical protein AAF633_08030 [Chloroflexota bacterium]
MQPQQLKTGVRFKRQEISTLLTLVSAEKVIGLSQNLIIEKNSAGYTAFMEGIQSLINSGLMSKKEGTYDIHPSLLLYIAVLSGPEKVISVHHVDAHNQTQTWRYYFSQKYLLALKEEQNHQFLLEPLSTYHHLIEHVQSNFRFKLDEVGAAKTIKIHPNQLKRLQLFFEAKQLGVIGTIEGMGRLESCGFIDTCTVLPQLETSHMLELIAEDEAGALFLLSLNTTKSTLQSSPLSSKAFGIQLTIV